MSFFYFTLASAAPFLAGCLFEPDWEEEEEVPEILVRPDDWDAGSEPSEEPLGSDIDSDGFLSDEDCDDWDPGIYPGAGEVWDSQDNDCDGWIDIDGEHAGTVGLEATAIYEGQPFFFSQTCPASSTRERGSISLWVDCEVDLGQEMAETLLGARLLLGVEADFLDGEAWDGRLDILSTGGPFDWDTQGEASLRWSGLEEDGGASLRLDGHLDAFSLDLTVEGALYR